MIVGTPLRGRRRFAPRAQDLEERRLLSGLFTEFPLPTAEIAGLPVTMTTGPDGNLWFTAQGRADAYSSFGRVNPDGTITEFRLQATQGHPGDIVAGADGDLWFPETGVGRIARSTSAGTITEFRIPTAGSHPSSLVAAPDGNLWFFEEFEVNDLGRLITSVSIGRITPQGQITEFPLEDDRALDLRVAPNGDVWCVTERDVFGVEYFRLRRLTPDGVLSDIYEFHGYDVGTIGLTIDPNSNAWLTYGQQDAALVRVDAHGVATNYTLPTPSSSSSIVTGPDGNVWLTEDSAGKIARVTPAGAIAEFAVPNAGHPSSLHSGPGDALFFLVPDGVGRVTPDGTITEFNPPAAKAFHGPLVTGPEGTLAVRTDTGLAEITSTGAVSTHTLPRLPVPGVSSRPTDIVLGVDGNLWFTESTADAVGRISPSGGVTEFRLPITSAPRGITVGKDGNLWFTETGTGKIGRMTPSGTLTEFAVSDVAGITLDGGITSGPDGNLWFTEQLIDTASVPQYAYHRIARITPAGTVTEFPARFQTGGPPATVGITSGPDGKLWLLTQVHSAVARVTVNGGVTEFPLPQSENAGLANVLGITTGPDHNVWFVYPSGSAIGRITPGGELTAFPPPAPGLGSGDVASAGGALWITFANADMIARVTIAGISHTFAVPTKGANPAGITAGPDGTLWFTEQGANKIGRLVIANAIVANAVPLNTTQGGNFTGTVATISAPAGAFTARIDWGDQTPATEGMVVPDGHGGYLVKGTHSYAATGTFRVTVTIANQTGGQAAVTSAATVSAGPAPAMLVSVRRFGVHRQPTRLVLTFSGPVDSQIVADPGQYVIIPLGPVGRPLRRRMPAIGITAASYDSVTESVTLSPSRRLGWYRYYLLQWNEPGGSLYTTLLHRGGTRAVLPTTIARLPRTARRTRL